MKKLLALVLAATLTIGMVVSAAATSDEESVSSPVAEATVLPEVVVEGEDGNILIILTATEDAQELTEDQQTVFAAAQENLEEAARDEEMACISLFYLEAYYVEESGEKTAITEPIDVTLKIDEVSKLEEIAEVRVMQYVNDEWVELEVVMNPDGTITIKGVVEGPIAIFAK